MQGKDHLGTAGPLLLKRADVGEELAQQYNRETIACSLSDVYRWVFLVVVEEFWRSREVLCCSVDTDWATR